MLHTIGLVIGALSAIATSSLHMLLDLHPVGPPFRHVDILSTVLLVEYGSQHAETVVLRGVRIGLRAGQAS